jgi:hypothetical protein
LHSFNETYYLVKKELLPNGDMKLILKNKLTGEVVQESK